MAEGAANSSDTLLHMVMYQSQQSDLHEAD